MAKHTSGGTYTTTCLSEWQITTHTPASPNPTYSRWYDHEWLKADYKPDPPPPTPTPHPHPSIWMASKHVPGTLTPRAFAQQQAGHSYLGRVWLASVWLWARAVFRLYVVPSSNRRLLLAPIDNKWKICSFIHAIWKNWPGHFEYILTHLLLICKSAETYDHITI